MPGIKREGRGKSQLAHPAPGRRAVAARPAGRARLGLSASLRSGAGRMLVGRGARAGRGMPRGWTALCLLSLLREYRPRAPGRAGRVGALPRRSAQSPGGAEGRDLGPTHAPRPRRLRAPVARGPSEPLPAGTGASPGKRRGGREGPVGRPPPPGSASPGVIRAARPGRPGVRARFLGVVRKVKRFEDASLFAWPEVRSAELEPEPGEGRREAGKFCPWELIPKAQ